MCRTLALSLLLSVPIDVLGPGYEAAASPIVNPSFEADGFINFAATSPTGWSFSTSDPDLRGDTLGVPTDGSRGGRFFLATSGAVSAGDAASLSQSIDLTNLLEISFDANLTCAPSGCGWHGFLEAAFYIDGTKRWASQSPGSVVDQVIDTSALSGPHTIEFRLEALAGGVAAGTSSHFSFDNVRAVPEPSAALSLAWGLVALALARRLGLL